MERAAAIRWLCLTAPLAIVGAGLPLGAVYLATGSSSVVVLLASAFGLVFIPMFTLSLYWGYRLRVASRARFQWDADQRRNLLKASLLMAASSIPAILLVSGLQRGPSTWHLVALVLYGVPQLLSLRCLAGVYTSRLAQGSPPRSEAPDAGRPLGSVYLLVFGGAAVGCLAVFLLYSGRLNEGTLAAMAGAALAGLGARSLWNASRAA